MIDALGAGVDRRLIVIAPLPLGYHRISVDAGVYGKAEGALIVVPAAVYLSPHGRNWGIAVQLYTVRSTRNWGIGDFTDLLGCIKLAANAGATYLGLNPLHAPHRNNPNAASPYAPTSRRFLNWLYIDVEAIPEADDVRIRAALGEPEFAASLATLRETSIVDYAGVARAKDTILRSCFKLARSQPVYSDDFREFILFEGVALERFAIFETLTERLGPNVADWPATYRNPRTPDVKAFAQAERPAIEYAKYLQYHAARQLEKAAEFARRNGVELYRDLAVGVDPNGADAWIDTQAYVPSVSVGAPPDLLNPDGGRAADGSRDVAGTPVLVAARTFGSGRHVRAIPIRGSARRARARKRARAVQRDRRRFGHGAQRLSRADEGSRSPLLPHPVLRARLRRRFRSR